MADVQKYNCSNFGAFAHDERNLNNPVEYRKNYEIKAARTHLNYDLISGKTGETAECGELRKRLEARLAQLTIRKRRANTVLFGSWLVTLPAELKESPAEKQREFFQHVVEFVQNRYGKANIIGAWVHNDETTPHVHIKFVPEQRAENADYNNFQGTGVLLAKDIFKRGEYQTFHRHLQKHLEQAMGMRLSIINGATKARGKNASIEELKGETALELEKTLEAAKAIQQAAEQWTESGKQAAALAEQFGDSVKDAKRQAGNGGFLKSGWQKKLEALLGGLASMQGQEETAQRAAAAADMAARLVPDWAKSGPALVAAAADMAARARRDADKEKSYWRSWQQKWQGRLLRQQQELERREAQLEALAEERAEEKLQARRDEVAALDKRREAAAVAVHLAEGQRDRRQQEAQEAQRELEQAVPQLQAARQQAEQAKQQQQQAERARDEAREQAEGWRRQGTPSAKLRAVLEECARRFGDGAVMTALQHAISRGTPSAAAERMAHIEMQQARAVHSTKPAAQQPHTPNRRPGLTR